MMTISPRTFPGSTPQEIHRNYRLAWHEAIRQAGGDPEVRDAYHLVPAAVRHELQEALRQTFLGRSGVTDPTEPPQPRARRRPAVVAPRPEITEDGHAVITCAGACGETKPAKKFATLRKGGRAAVCRDCQTAARG